MTISNAGQQPSFRPSQAGPTAARPVGGPAQTPPAAPPSGAEQTQLTPTDQIQTQGHENHELSSQLDFPSTNTVAMARPDDLGLLDFDDEDPQDLPTLSPELKTSLDAFRQQHPEALHGAAVGSAKLERLLEELIFGNHSSTLPQGILQASVEYLKARPDPEPGRKLFTQNP